ncbi:MAG TPA: hypothetical protein VKO85_03375 [Wenzhouxiangellaceae bacterium]|nr:hypothetical protein [Wenzhouxiangellaceae bacterium]
MNRFTLFIIASLGLAATGAVAQNNYHDWAAAGKPDRDTANATAGSADIRGGALTFADRASFDSAVGSLPLEDFEGGATAAGAVNTCTEPVSSASNDVCFAPGDLIAGFQLTSSGGGGVVALGDGFIGQPTTVVGANTFGDFATVTFTGGNVTAVGLDAYSGSGGGDVDIRVFDSGGTLADTITLAPSADNVSEFFGIFAPGPISRIEIEGTSASGELLDNLAFGTGSQEPPAAVPTLGAVGTFLGIAMLLLIAGFALRARATH